MGFVFSKGEYWDMQGEYCTGNIGHLRADRNYNAGRFVSFRHSNIEHTELCIFRKNVSEREKTSVLDTEFPAISGLCFIFLNRIFVCLVFFCKYSVLTTELIPWEEM
jgi:hypothetical protein